jgi:HEAT repeat protein
VEAAEALQRHPPELAAPALREVLDNRDGYFSAATRAAAVRALGVLLPTGDGDAFATAVADLDASVSLAAIGALVERREDTSVDVLLRVLEDRKGFYVPPTRHAAARGLALLGMGDPRRVSALLQNESDAIVREALASLPAR